MKNLIILFFIGLVVIFGVFTAGRAYENRRLSNILENGTHNKGTVIYCMENVRPITTAGCFQILGN